MLNVLALCAGVGGLELGVRLGSGGQTRTVCYVEREAYAAGVLAARMEDGTLDQAPIWSDLATFDGRPWRGVVDIVTAGYPCQPFSVAGKRLGNCDPRHLWPHVARTVAECDPGLVFCENVAAHVRVGLDRVIGDMGAMGYRVAVTLQTASEHGAWHKRERLFWLASRNADHASASDSHGEPRALEPGRRCRPGGSDSVHTGGNGSQRLVRFHGWESEPAVGRVVDGVACRVDRLRATGNGVVPQVAANAFLELAGVLNAS